MADLGGAGGADPAPLWALVLSARTGHAGLLMVPPPQPPPLSCDSFLGSRRGPDPLVSSCMTAFNQLAHEHIHVGLRRR